MRCVDFIRYMYVILEACLKLYSAAPTRVPWGCMGGGREGSETFTNFTLQWQVEIAIEQLVNRRNCAISYTKLTRCYKCSTRKGRVGGISFFYCGPKEKRYDSMGSKNPLWCHAIVRAWCEWMTWIPKSYTQTHTHTRTERYTDAHA